jgi:hypothetical protein
LLGLIINREKDWFLQSEKMYYQEHQTYYRNIHLVGLEYKNLDYSHALPFFADVVSTPFFEPLISWKLNLGIGFRNIIRVIVSQFLSLQLKNPSIE